MRATLQRSVQRWSLALGGLLLALLLAEVAVRQLVDVEPILRIRDPLLGKKYQPGLSGSFWVREAGRKVPLRFNSDGFRGPDRVPGKQPGLRRVAVLGDSMVAAVAVDEPDTLVGALERKLNGDSDERWEVMNYGVAGSGTAQDLLVYRHVASKYEPDVVVCVYFMINDFADNSPELSSRRVYFEVTPDDRLEQLPFPSHSSALSPWLNQHSRLYVWQKLVLSGMRGKLFPHLGYWIFDTQPDTRIEAAWQLNTRIVRELAAEVAAAGQEFLLVLCPGSEQVAGDQWQRVVAALSALGVDDASRLDPDYPQQRLSAFADEHGIRCLDLTPPFRAHTGELLYIDGYGHLTEAGNRLAMESVFAALVSD